MFVIPRQPAGLNLVRNCAPGNLEMISSKIPGSR